MTHIACDNLIVSDSKHDIVCDIKRVAQQLGYPPSRDEYSKLGNYSIRKIRNAFGTFTEAIFGAGFKPKAKRQRHQFDNQLLRYQTDKDIQDRFQKEIKPWCGKYERKHKDDLILVQASDFHSHFVEGFCLEVFLDVCADIQPQVIVLGGDIYDFYQLSRFDKDPSRVMKLQSELDYIEKKVFIPLRQRCPDATIDFVIGNHEWRLFKYLSSKSPALSNLRCLQFNNLFNLDEYEINLVCRDSFLTAGKDKSVKNYKIYNDCYVFAHGTAGGQYPAAAEMKKYGMSGASGHVHRHQAHTSKDLHGSKIWTCLPTMAKIELAEDYIWDVDHWNQGFLITHITKDKRIATQPIVFNEGFACVGGTYYRDRKRN